MKANVFEVLSHDEMVQIDRESRRILEEVGIRVLHDQCLDLLEDAGCKVDRSCSRVRIPSDFVQKAIDATPSSFSLYGRDASFRIDLGDDHTLTFFREHFDPTISNRKNFENWSADGAQSVKDRARTKAKAILSQTPEHTVDPKLTEELYRIVKKAEPK